MLLMPGDPLPAVPAIAPPGRWSFDYDRQAFVEIARSDDQDRRIPHPDLFARAAEIDPSNREAAVQFINEYGPMGVDPTVLIDIGAPPSRSDIWRRRDAFYGQSVVFSDDLERLEQEQLRLRKDRPKHCREPRVGYEGAEAFASGVESLRIAVDAWLWLSEVLPTAPGEAAEMLAVVLDDALSVFAPRVHWLPDGGNVPLGSDHPWSPDQQDDPKPSQAPRMAAATVWSSKISPQLAMPRLVVRMIEPCS